MNELVCVSVLIEREGSGGKGHARGSHPVRVALASLPELKAGP